MDCYPVAEVAAGSSQDTIFQAVDCVRRRVAEGVVGSLGVRRYFERHVDAPADVDPGGDAALELLVHS